jgi:pyruvate-formate lyase-activating enzyme
MINKKILCIGNETENTDVLVTALAKQNSAINHGLIISENFVPIKNGYYHTSIADVPAGDIISNLARHFDLIVMLDQDIDSYPHWKSFVHTFKLMIALEKKDIATEFRNNLGNSTILYWYDLLRTNKSICVYPFIALNNDYGSVTQCQKNPIPVTKIEKITDWSTDPAFGAIRDNMLAGIQMPERCGGPCYEREQHDGESARQFESLEWVMELGLKNITDLKDLKDPAYIEIRPSNKCNIMCRMCDDMHSHLIEKEYIKIGWPIQTDQWRMQDFPWERINFDTVKRIHYTGGDPTVMPEFYTFLRRCIKQNQTNFYLTIGTNGHKISATVWDLLKEFPNVNFSVSFDGYKKVNDYIRWGSDFESIRKNCYLILEKGHQLAFQTVFMMYNATRIHEVYEFYDREFPGHNTLVQPASDINNYLGPWHNPLKEQVLESMYRCRETKVYHNNGRNADNLVDEVISRYQNHKYDPKLLADFFAYNDQLDKSRGSRLEDYIPELAKTRHLCHK